MNRTIASLLLAAASWGLTASAQSVALPYTSNMYVGLSTLDEGWTKANNGNRRSLGFDFDRENDASKLTTPGTTSAASHDYDSEYDANCWLFSPAFDLRAGGQYAVGVWAKTRGGDPENFKLCYGSEASASAMTTTVFDKNGFLSSDDYQFVSAIVTPESDITVHFGINCYSPANSYVLSLTGFSVSDENGSTEVPEKPQEPVTASGLPYEYAFTSSADFAKHWTCVNGPDAALADKWTINEYSGWAVFDVAQGVKEDNWVISEPLNFAEAGPYALVYKGLVSGKLEFLLGTDPEDLTGFTSIASYELSDSYDNDAEVTLAFSVAEPGEYRLAVRACADPGTFMGYRMKSIKVRSDNPTPAIVSDLQATASALDELSVALSWTNPSTDHQDGPLYSLTRLELYRNGEMIKDDFLTLTPGAPNAWMDEPAEAGVYTYHVLAYNANGCADAAPREVSAGYVGRPTAAMPYSASSSYASDMALMTSVDANADGHAWTFIDEGSTWYNTMKVEVDEGDSFDDYLISPYLHLTPGYYVFDYSVSCRYNSFEAGYVTDRHSPADTFVKLSEFLDWPDYGAPTGHNVIVIEEEGDYALCIHAIGQSSNPSYRDLKLNDLSLSATLRLPTAVRDLSASDSEGNEGFDVSLRWTNPTHDNAGLPLGSDEALTITVKRDGQAVATLSGADYLPGRPCVWTDKGLDAGEYAYTVEVANENGSAEGKAPAVTIYAGPVLQLPYSTADFSEWLIDDSGIWPWEIDPATGHATWVVSYTWNPAYSVFTPYLRLEAGKSYLLEATFDGNDNGYTQGMSLVSAPKLDEYSTTLHHSFTLPENAIDHQLSLVLVASDAAEAAAQSDDEEGAEPEAVSVPAGKFLLGFRPTEAGKVTLKSFSLRERTTVGISEIEAQGPAAFADGIVSFPAETDIRVCDLAGRTLRAVRASALDLRSLRGAGVVIVSAPGHRALKLVL